MKVRLLFCLCVCLSVVASVNAQQGHGELQFLRDVGKGMIHELFPKRVSYTAEITLEQENPRAVAAALTVLAGPFGAHRIYLGTTEWVPVFYTLTLGGGLGVLPFIDLVYILVKNDISGCYHNPHIFMWAQKKADP